MVISDSNYNVTIWWLVFVIIIVVIGGIIMFFITFTGGEGFNLFF